MHPALTPPHSTCPAGSMDSSHAENLASPSTSKAEPVAAGHGAQAPSPPDSADSSLSPGSKKRSSPDTDESQSPDGTTEKRAKIAAPNSKSKRAPKPKAMPPVATRASGRVRMPIERFSDYVPPKKAKFTTSKSAASKSSPKTASGREPKTKKAFDPHFVTTDPRSRLNNIDVFHMLLEPSAWTSLNPEEKLEILDLLPSGHINTKLANELRAGTAAPNAMPREFSLNFDLFRTDVAKYKEELYFGQLTEGWQKEAEQASRDRAAGAVDDWKEAEMESWYGQN